MAVNAREIKGRLRSIKNTKKITHTMELVSAAKMRRAVSSALSSRLYSSLAWELIGRLRQTTELKKADPRLRWFTNHDQYDHTTIIVLSSNRGLCGAFTTNVLRLVKPFLNNLKPEQYDVIAVGKRGAGALTALGVKVEQVYEKDDAARTDASMRSLASIVYKQFSENHTQRVMVAYTDYKSSVSQQAVLRQLYPLLPEETISAGIENLTEQPLAHIQRIPVKAEYIYEPGPEVILDYIIPRIAEVQLYQALLESNASEHSARMMAMKNATDAAGDMANELLLAFNRARQGAITQEIAEISAGSAAVS